MHFFYFFIILFQIKILIEMKKLLLLNLVLVFIINDGIYSQQDILSRGSYYCYLQKTSGKNPIFNTGDSPNSPRHTFDVLNYTLNLDIRSCFISPYPHSYTAYEIVQFKVDTALTRLHLMQIIHRYR